MRTSNILKASIEQHREPEYVLSLEEEAVELVEAAELQAEVVQDIAEVNKLTETSQVMEDMAAVADSIEEATPAETQLIEMVGDVAVAGTDVDASEIVPAMESFTGKRISTEAIKERAIAIWESIQKFIARIWAAIEQFFYKVFGTIPGMRKKIEALQAKVKDLGDKKPEAGKMKLMLTRSAQVNGKLIDGEATLLTSLKDMGEASHYVYKDHVSFLTKSGDIIAKAIDGFEPTKAAEHAEGLRAKLEAHAPKAVPGNGNSVITAGVNMKVTAGSALMGNNSLALVTSSIPKEVGTLGALDMLRRTGVTYAATTTKVEDKSTFMSIGPMTKAGMETALKACLSLIDTLETFKRGSDYTNLLKLHKSIEAASTKATKTMKDESADVVAAKPYFRSMLNFNATYMNWVSNPAMAMYRGSLSAVGTTLSIVSHSVSMYK